MNTKFQSIITGEPKTKEDINRIISGTARIIDENFEEQKDILVNDEKNMLYSSYELLNHKSDQITEEERQRKNR